MTRKWTWLLVGLQTHPRIQMENGKFGNTSAFPVPHEDLGIRQTDQSCHHEVWFTWILLSGAAVNHITKDRSDHSS